MLIYKHLFTQDIHNRYKKGILIIKYIRNKSCFSCSGIYGNVMTLAEFISEDLHTPALRGKEAASQQNSGNDAFSNISSSPTVWEQTSPAELQLSLVLWCVQEDGAVGGQDLPGPGGGQLASGPHQAHAVSFPQGQDQTEGHRASAAAVAAG